MKKFFFISLLIVGITTVLFAQTESTGLPYKNSIKLSPLGFNFNSFYLNYERRLGNDYGLVFTGGLYYYENNNSNNYISFPFFDYNVNANMNGYLSELQFRNYFFTKHSSANKWTRFFFAPYGFYRYYDVKDYYPDYSNLNTLNKKDYTIQTFGGGCVIGISLEVNKFSMEIFTGGGIKLGNTDMEDEVENNFKNEVYSPAYKGIVPKFGFNLGFNF